MSTVFLHVGQCGNQLGQQFWQLVQQDDEAKCTFYRRDQKLPSLHVDTEKKVIAKLLRNSKQLPVREKNVILSKQGRGTNWAMGYHGTSTNPSESMIEVTLEVLRKEVERCDSFCGTVMMHSLSGGTGSGLQSLGSHLCEAVRDTYPMAYILDVAVAPHTQGESPLQHYNNLFCLAWLQKFADCVILYHNDEVLHHLQGLNITKGNRDAANVDIKMMNKYITDSLAGLLCPISSNTTRSGISSGNEPWELLRSVSPMPAHKFLHVSHVMKSKSTWEAMTTNLIQSAVRYDTDGQHYSSLASLVAVRGDPTSTFMTSLSVIERKLKAALGFVEWNPFPIDFWIGKQQGVLPKDTSSMTMCVNTSRIVSMMQRVQSRARSMYDARAFLHWYQRYSCDETEFEEAFATVNQVIRDYESAAEG
ncbi:tubulin delta chain-like isoform X1 [Lytechinus pictus]|uniref:tubulin delta chain-like isoform X1 n=1 Tax=Lytechinus pictus TaxID=7653 RepID=UPI0030BA1AB5